MHKIYWFSGTGNTLKIARTFSERLGGAELISIPRLDRSEDIVLSGETVGIFFPVYCLGVPSIITKFIERIKSADPDTYIYAVCTSGGMRGAALPMVEDDLAEKRIDLSAAFHIVMPNSYIPLSGAASEKRIAKLFAKAEKKVDEAITAINAFKRTRPLRIFPIDTIQKFISRRAVGSLEGADKWFWTDDKCNGCGLCSKICPASNISMVDGKPSWHHHCEQCMACLQWCPEKSIQFRKSSLKRKRYHHPDIKPNDIARVTE